ncbi:choice-of-anchor L domain-containing protein [Shimia abyssi]|uniref:Hint domain-containing protein n=1 Tax=Shimia abyssi TaxID=1662395 RepID=A0A2P8F4C1_9RHOB|nr:choice-of-anchor L domain-containing protein [Shimia abyssi]PSL16567.1 Hint domain-containing protein [Shimia abyssi]
MPTASELPIDTSASAMDMANSMFGSGISIESASYTGANAASGIYSDGDAVAPGVTPSDTGVILSTGRATSITNSSGDANTSSGTSSNNRTAGDSDLDDLSGVKTYDAAVFEAEFVPDGSTLTMQVVFSSEEYLEYVNSGFNDAVGIWVNGEQAELTVGDGDITINNINDQYNENLYIDNPANAEVANTEMDGFTITLTLKAPVVPGQTNTIKIAIADGGDRVYDSNLMIAGDSVQTALVAQDDDIEVEAEGTGTFDILANDSSQAGGTLTITAINGEPVVAGSSVMLPTGEIITLNDDGTISVETDEDTGTNIFTYEVEDEDGNTDIGYVNLETSPGVACFVAGTLIITQTGLVPVEQLEPGHKVMTRDNGFQPLRWIGMATKLAIGKDAPIQFNAGALGQHDKVEFSPNHRVLYKSHQATLLFGESEVLVKAKDMVNGTTITRREDGSPVTYVHILFDRHEIVRANGLDSESYHPGRETLDNFDPETRDEILRLMPNLDAMMGYGYGPAARVSLRQFEARALLSVA